MFNIDKIIGKRKQPSIDLFGKNKKMSQIGIEKKRPPHFTLYHGTDEKSYEQIKERGLIPGIKTNRLTFPNSMRTDKGEKVFLTSKPSYATFYAESASKQRQSEPVVLKVKVPTQDIKQESFEFESAYYGQDEFAVDEIKAEQIQSVEAKGEKESQTLFLKSKTRDWGRDHPDLTSERKYRELQAQENFSTIFSEGPSIDEESKNKNRLFREHVTNKINIRGWFTDKDLSKEQADEQINTEREEHKELSKRWGDKYYPPYRKGSYKYVTKDDIIKTVTKNPQMIPLLNNVEFRDLYKPDEPNTIGEYQYKSQGIDNTPVGVVRLPLYTKKKHNIPYTIKHELAHHIQATETDDYLDLYDEGQELKRSSDKYIQHKDLPVEKDAEEKIKTDERLKNINNTSVDISIPDEPLGDEESKDMVKIFGSINDKRVRFDNINEMRNHPIKEDDEITLILGDKHPVVLRTYEEVKNYKRPAYEKYGYPRGHAKRLEERRHAKRLEEIKGRDKSSEDEPLGDEESKDSKFWNKNWSKFLKDKKIYREVIEDDESKNMPFVKKTGVPIVDYPKEYSSYTSKTIKKMSPEQFLNITKDEAAHSALSAGNYDEQKKYSEMSLEEYRQFVEQPHKTESVRKGLDEGKNVPGLYIDYDDKGIPKGHEGRHRAFAAMDRGDKEVPVSIMTERPTIPVEGSIFPKWDWTVPKDDVSVVDETQGEFEGEPTYPYKDEESKNMAIRWGRRPNKMDPEEWEQYKTRMDTITKKDTSALSPYDRINTILDNDKNLKKLRQKHFIFRDEEWYEEYNREAIQALKEQGYSEEDAVGYLSEKQKSQMDAANVFAKELSKDDGEIGQTFKEIAEKENLPEYEHDYKVKTLKNLGKFSTNISLGKVVEPKKEEHEELWEPEEIDYMEEFEEKQERAEKEYYSQLQKKPYNLMTEDERKFYDAIQIKNMTNEESKEYFKRRAEELGNNRE